MAKSKGRPVLVLGEFESADELMSAAERVRDAGFTHWDCYTPYPVHGLDAKMGVKATALPWFVLGGGLTGCTIGFLMQWYMNATELPFFLSGYPFMISGKPTWSVPANIPVSFELTILLSAFGAFFGMLALNGLPRFYRPHFRSERFRRATNDRYFIGIEARDRSFDPAKNQDLLSSLGASHVEVVEE